MEVSLLPEVLTIYFIFKIKIHQKTSLSLLNTTCLHSRTRTYGTNLVWGGTVLVCPTALTTARVNVFITSCMYVHCIGYHTKGEVVLFLLLKEQYQIHINIVTRAIRMIYRVSPYDNLFITYLCFRSDCIYHAIKNSETKKISLDQKRYHGARVIQRYRSDITGDIVFRSRCYHPDKGTSM